MLKAVLSESRRNGVVMHGAVLFAAAPAPAA